MDNQSEQITPQGSNLQQKQQTYQTPYQSEIYQKQSPEQIKSLSQGLGEDLSHTQLSPPKFDTQATTFKYLLLEIASGHSAGLQYWISRFLEFPIKIGRGQQNQVILQEDDISTLHCYMWYDSSKHTFQIQDRGSLHGTCVQRGEEQLNVTGLKRTPGQKVELQLGDLLKLGQSNAFKVTCSSQDPPQSAIIVNSHNSFNESFNMKPVASIDLDRSIGLQASQSDSINQYFNGNKSFQTPKVLKPQNKLQVEVPRNKEWLQEISDQINDFQIQTSPIKQTSTYSDFRLIISSVSIQGRDHSRHCTPNQDLFFWDVPLDENKENLDNEDSQRLIFSAPILEFAQTDKSNSPRNQNEMSLDQLYCKRTTSRPSSLKLPINNDSQSIQNFSLVTLIDGHGGTQCNHYVRQYLPQFMQYGVQQRFDQQQQTPSKRSFTFLEPRNEQKKVVCLGGNSPTTLNSKEENNQCNNCNVCDSQDNSVLNKVYKSLFKEVFLNTDTKLLTDDGCTCTSLLFHKESNTGTTPRSSNIQPQSHTINLTCANVGDSHALVWKGAFPKCATQNNQSRMQVDHTQQINASQQLEQHLFSFQATVLTEDHRVASANEKKRLNQIQAPISNDRLFGLNIARCLGDTQLKNQDVGFSNEPYVSTTIEIQRHETALVIVASDGLWDFVTFEEVNKLVQEDILSQIYQVQQYQFQQKQYQPKSPSMQQQQRQMHTKQHFENNSSGLENGLQLQEQKSEMDISFYDSNLKDSYQSICMESIKNLLQKAVQDSKDDITVGLCMIYSDA